MESRESFHFQDKKIVAKPKEFKKAFQLNQSFFIFASKPKAQSSKAHGFI